MSYYTYDELYSAGFSQVGRNVKISNKTSLYAINGTIGSNVRIDDFCVLKGSIVLGSYIHIASYCLISGTRGLVTVGDFAGIASSVLIYTGSDDYSASTLHGPTVPEKYTKTICGDVYLAAGTIVGCQSIILPNTRINACASIGAQCLIYGEVLEGAVITSGVGKLRNVKSRDSHAIHQMMAELKQADNAADLSHEKQ